MLPSILEDGDIDFQVRRTHLNTLKVNDLFYDIYWYIVLALNLTCKCVIFCIKIVTVLSITTFCNTRGCPVLILHDYIEQDCFVADVVLSPDAVCRYI